MPRVSRAIQSDVTVDAPAPDSPTKTTSSPVRIFPGQIQPASWGEREAFRLGWGEPWTEAAAPTASWVPDGLSCRLWVGLGAAGDTIDVFPCLSEWF
jgi:hypothetical protein